MNNSLRRTWAEVNLDNLAYNFNYVKSKTSAKLCCVIKADGYGHGAVELARRYESIGADFFAVSNIEEAMQLRLACIKTPILILGYTPVNQVDRLAEFNISQCVYSKEYGESLSAEAVKQNQEIKIHVKIDTGMSRLGFFFQDFNRDEAVIDEIVELCKLPNLIHDGIFTHFAVADEGKDGDNFTMRQYGCFKELLESLARLGITFKYRHCANSGAIKDFPLSHLDMVRAGIILYGLEPSDLIRDKGGLKPVLELKSVVSHLKYIEEGTTVSYGRKFTAQNKTRIATVPIGYADGYSRLLSDRGEMIVGGKRCKILGRVCMDQLMLDVSHVEGIGLGDEVVVIGKQGNEEITATELANIIGTINYEIVCDIGARVPRVYLENGVEVGVLDYILPSE